MTDFVVRADDEPSKKAAEIEAALKADKSRRDAEGDDRHQQLCDAIQDMAKGMTSIMDRMDAFESKKRRKDSEEDLDDLDDDDENLGRPRRTFADDEHELIGAQAKADEACVMLGMKAPPPMMGERLLAYRQRLLRPLQQHSDAFKDVDLGVAAVDSPMFDAIEARIYADAVEAGKNPSAAPGVLVERSSTRGGHTFTEFYGDPRTWMGANQPIGQAVTGFGSTNTSR